MCTRDEYKHNEDGAAVIFSCVQKLPGGSFKTIHANIGDSRTILARWRDEGKGYEAIACTFDHKPTDPAERARIEAAGGSVTVSILLKIWTKTTVAKSRWPVSLVQSVW